MKNDDEKIKIRHRLALVYAITAWNTVIYVFYLNMKDNLPTDEESKLRFVEKITEKKKTDVEYVTIHGFELQKQKSEKTESISEGHASGV